MSVEPSDTTQLPVTETVEVLKSCHKCGKTGLQRLKSHLHTMHAEKVNVTFADGTRRTVFRESDDPTEGSSFRCPRCQRIYYNTMQLQASIWF
ncbi:hypothetical protein PHLCEN_2v7505 [Hermanssonia centrifuga]|uniref:Uncharacterized protein n=1 Tax=Hermanssonia centrifuga TaxID=98765 RepID=A0A2R6NWE6_9APHY|nr:hypothetical protein PHLCEN_2v7505 [Hermanssonia centrifuga]